MIKNTLGKTALLRSLVVGEPAVWYCEANLADPDMRNFTATIHNAKLKIKIKQRKAMLVLPDTIPQTVVVIERVE